MSRGARGSVDPDRLAELEEERRFLLRSLGDLEREHAAGDLQLLRALGVEGRIKSPSYAVMESYELPGGSVASHFDFYRFGDPREWEDAGFRDVFAAPGLKLCEWPEKAAGQLPPADLQLFIELMPDDSRHVRAVGSRKLVEALA